MKPIPKIPNEIVNAIVSNKLILLVGAGVSKLFGEPLWHELASKLLDECEKRKCLSKSKILVIKRSPYTSMQLVTIACALLDARKPNLGTQILCEILDKHDTSKKRNVERLAKILSNLNCPILTTNADNILDESGYFPKESIYYHLPTDCEITQVVQGKTIIHIHGSTKEPAEMIFRAPQYLEKYNPTSNFGKTLSEILPQTDSSDSNVLLCVGYGAKEFELLRYLVKSGTPKSGYKMFILNGYYEFEEFRVEIDSEYFKSINFINVPYSLEKYDYENLIKVLEKWYSTIDKIYALNESQMEQLEKIAAEKPNTYSIRRAKVILQDGDANVFYRAFLKSSHLCDWILALKDFEPLFSVKANFLPAKKHNNGYRSSVWGGLNLIESCVRGKADNIDLLDFSVSILNKSLDYLKSQKETNSVASICSSSAIMHCLLSLATANPYIFNNFEFQTFAKIFADSPFDDVDSVFYTLFQRSDYSNFDREKLFKFIENSIERTVFGKNEKYHFEVSTLKNENFVKNIIEKDNNKYFKLASENLNKILTNNFVFADMSSFSLYPDTFGIEDVKLIPIMIFKQTSYKLSFDDAKMFFLDNIDSPNRVLKKASVCLLINNKELYDSYFSSAYFKDIETLPDLFVYLDSIKSQIISNDKLKNIINEILEFDFEENDYYTNLLKKKLQSYLSTDKCEFSKQEDTSLKNLTRKIYVSSGVINPIKFDFNSKTFLEIKDYYSKNIKNDTYSSHMFCEKFNNYFSEHKEYVINNLDDFMQLDSRIICSFGNVKLFKDNAFSFEEQTQFLLKAKEYHSTDENINEFIVDNLMNLLKSDDNDFAKIEEVVEKVDITAVSFDSNLIENELKSPITYLINIPYCRFLRSLCTFAGSDFSFVCKIKKAIRYLKENCKNVYIAKMIVAYCYPFIYKLDYSYAEELQEFAFENIINGINYSLFASLSSGGFYYLPNSFVKEIPSSRDFLLMNSKTEADEFTYAREIYIIYLTYRYFEYDDSNLIEIINKMSHLNLYVECIGEIETNHLDPKYAGKLTHLLDSFVKSFRNKELIGESDILLRHLADLIIKTEDKYKQLWDMLVSASVKFNDYFSDELADIIKKYGNNHKHQVKKLLSNVFEFSNEWFILVDDRIVEIINLVRNDEYYNKSIFEWISLLKKRNPNIKLTYPDKIK